MEFSDPLSNFHVVGSMPAAQIYRLIFEMDKAGFDGRLRTGITNFLFYAQVRIMRAESQFEQIVSFRWTSVFSADRMRPLAHLRQYHAAISQSSFAAFGAIDTEAVTNCRLLQLPAMRCRAARLRRSKLRLRAVLIWSYCLRTYAKIPHSCVNLPYCAARRRMQLSTLVQGQRRKVASMLDGILLL